MAAAQSTRKEANRLFNQDRLIAGNALRATFARSHDRVIAAIVMLAAVTALRAWFAGRPWTIAAWAATGAGTMIGIGAGRLLATRLAFQAFDGLLAVDALHPKARQRYVVAWHGVGLALLTVATMIARPSLLLVSVPAYLAGVLVATLAGGAEAWIGVAGTGRPRLRMRAWRHRPLAGFAAAMLLLLSLLPSGMLDMDERNIFVGVEALLLALALTSVDDAIVRFITITGHGSGRIIARHIGAWASFLAVAAPGCWLLLGPIASGIVAAAGVATLLRLTLRILAYRLHAKRFADLVVSFLAGLLVLITYALPVAMPIVALAVLWQLERRGRTKTWLLA